MKRILIVVALLLVSVPVSAATLVSTTVKAADGDYASILTWDADNGGATSGDLVAVDEALRVTCYDVDDETAGVLSMNSYTTDATHTIIIQGAVKNAGVWATDRYYLKFTGTYSATTPFYSTSGFVYVRDIQIWQSGSGTGMFGGSFGEGGLTISGCILRQGYRGLLYRDSSGGGAAVGNLVMYNNVVIAVRQGISGAGVAGNGLVLYGNTFITTGSYNALLLNCANGETCIAKNNILQSAGATDYAETGTVDNDFNLCGDASCAGAHDVQPVTLTFVNAAAYDYHLHADDSAAVGAGTVLSAPYTTDIDGGTRGIAFDIGADEYGVDGGSPVELDGIFLGIGP